MTFFDEDPHTFAIRTPSRPYGDSVWQATNGEQTSSFLREEERLNLGGHYAQAANAHSQNAQITELTSRLSILTKPIDLDPGVRLSLLQQIEEIRGYNRWMNIRTGQMVDNIVKLRMSSSRERMAEFIGMSRTVQFCQSHGYRHSQLLRLWFRAPVK